jgi:hypothetical protein
MYNPYDLHSLSKQYREDALRESRARLLAERACDNRASGGGRHLGLNFGLIRKGVLTLLGRGLPAEERSV